MPAKNDVFFSAASCKKDIIFGGHLFSFSAVPISLGLYKVRPAVTLISISTAVWTPHTCLLTQKIQPTCIFSPNKI
jgi:hypothetical protein